MKTKYGFEKYEYYIDVFYWLIIFLMGVYCGAWLQLNLLSTIG